MISEDDVRTAMKQVEDPELGINVVDLGLLYGVDISEEGYVRLEMTLTSMGCPLTEQILGDSRAAIMPLEGVSGVEIGWVWEPAWSPEMMTEEGRFMMKVMGYG